MGELTLCVGCLAWPTPMQNVSGLDWMVGDAEMGEEDECGIRNSRRLSFKIKILFFSEENDVILTDVKPTATHKQEGGRPVAAMHSETHLIPVLVLRLYV